MTNQPDKLDELLSAWSRHHEPSSARLENLRDKIFDAAKLHASPITRPTTAWRISTRIVSLAAALACCVVLAVLIARTIPGAKMPAASLPPAASQLPREHLETLFSEMDRLFDERVAWVAETNQEVSLALGESSPSRGPLVAVRVVVLKRSSDAKSWQPIWTGDVASRPEEMVQFALTNDASRLRLWTYVLPDGAVAVDTELGVDRNGPIWKSSSVQQPQVPQQVLSARTSESEFQVWQTAAILPEAAL